MKLCNYLGLDRRREERDDDRMNLTLNRENGFPNEAQSTSQY